MEVGGLNEAKGDVLGFRGGVRDMWGFFVGGVLDVGGLGISCVVWVVLTSMRISEAGGFSMEIMMRSIDCLCVAIVYDRSKPAHV